MQLVAKEVSKSYPKFGVTKGVIQNLSLDVSSSEFVSIIGSNGSGKSTLLRLIAGIEQTDSGFINISGLKKPHSPRVAFLWQDYRSANFPWLTAWQNVTLPMRMLGTSRGEDFDAAECRFIDLLPDVTKRSYISELSGGQQQILSLVRGMSSKAEIILADEPLSALDQARTWAVIKRVEEFWIKRRPLTIWVSHNIDEAILLSDRIILLSRHTKNIARELKIDSSRPRSPESLRSEKHIEIRNEIIAFLLSEQGLSQAP